MSDIARFIRDFENKKEEYINAVDKTKTALYRHIKDNGYEMSVIKLSNRGNMREEAIKYCRETGYVGREGMVFTIDSGSYILLNYNDSSRHANIRISDLNIEKVCDAIVVNGEGFNIEGMV